MKKKDQTRRGKKSALAAFFYEVGTLRKVARSHRQTLLEDDLSDNISSHTYRVTIIAWFLAMHEKTDPYKTVMMALFHDIPEARTNDHNWVHKKYVKLYEDEVLQDQIKPLPFGDTLFGIISEYELRESKEAKLAKDADLLDQILLLREYEHRGNKEASTWLVGKQDPKHYFSNTAKKLAKEIRNEEPGSWWHDISTNLNR